MPNQQLFSIPAATPTQRTDFTFAFSDSLVKLTEMQFSSEPRSLFAYQIMVTPSAKLNAMPVLINERDVILLSKSSKQNFT